MPIEAIETIASMASLDRNSHPIVRFNTPVSNPSQSASQSAKPASQPGINIEQRERNHERQDIILEAVGENHEKGGVKSGIESARDGRWVDRSNQNGPESHHATTANVASDWRHREHQP